MPQLINGRGSSWIAAGVSAAAVGLVVLWIASAAGPGVQPSAARVPGAAVASADPAACRQFGFSERRCKAVVDAALEQLGSGHPPITAIELLPDDAAGVVRTTQFVARVRFQFSLGESTQLIVCGVGGDYSIVCTERPRIATRMDFDWDVPCTGEAPEGPCATALPTPDDVAVGLALPLEVPRLDRPLPAVGHYEIPAGRAVLPNGYLTEARFDLADDTTQAYHVKGPVRLVLRPTDPSRPPFSGSVMQRPLTHGPETVDVFIVLDVVDTSADAEMQIRDLVVR